MNGYVYILKNAEYPGKFKIGKTNEHPEVRANQLSKQTSSVGKFEVFWSAKTGSPELGEKFLHILFAPNHFEKEFYDLSIYDEDLLLKVLKEFDEFNISFAKLQSKLMSARILKLKNDK
jgi:hypothetical protein